MKESSSDRDELLKKPVIFCTECETELQNFCFSRGADDVEALKRNLAQCRKKGKFAGEFCSKLFIAGSQSDGFWAENED